MDIGVTMRVRVIVIVVVIVITFVMVIVIWCRHPISIYTAPITIYICRHSYVRNAVDLPLYINLIYSNL